MIVEIFYDQVYTGRFYQPRPGDVVVDAGANVGAFSVHISMLEPKCHVHAFEPFDENFLLLQENLVNSGFENVKAYRMAVTGEGGTACIARYGARSQDHRVLTPKNKSAAGEQVPTVNLAGILKMSGNGEIAMFKCDIEGSEFGLFQSAANEDIRRIRRFAIEYHDNIRSGTSELLLTRLNETHEVRVASASAHGYGMIYAVRKTSSIGNSS